MRVAALAVLVAACHARTSVTIASASAATSAAVSVFPIAPNPPRSMMLDPTGIGFDDLAIDVVTHDIIAPTGAGHSIVTFDPSPLPVRSIAVPQVAEEKEGPYESGRHDVGVTSAVSSSTRWFATDRTGRVVFSLLRGDERKYVYRHLAASPDYVRVVFDEIWVTEPDASQIEVFDEMLKNQMTFAIPGGPESLVVSASRKMAYANLWHAKSVEIDIAKHAITRTFDSGCDKARGIALDDVGSGLFVACNDGRVVRIDLASGKIAAEGRAGDGVDIIDFSPKTGHLYVPAARGGTLTVFDAKLAIVKTAPVPKGAHCVVADDRGQAWVCDPDHGSLVVFSENP